MADPVNLRQLLYFLTAVERGSMTAAATQLHVSQSAISLAIAELERRLGVSLLVRHPTKGLALTSAGTAIVPSARALLGHASELQATARSISQGLEGDLVVGCASTMAPFVMPGLLDGFRKLHSGVRVDFIEGSTPELAEQVRSGVCELALLYQLQPLRGTDTEVLRTIRPSLLTYPGNPLAEADSVGLADLVAQPLILLDHPPSLEYYTTVLSQAGVTPEVRFRTTSFEMARSLVARGFGSSLLLQRPAITTSYEGLPLVTRPLRDRLAGVPVAVVTPHGVRPSRRASEFIRFCRTAL